MKKYFLAAALLSISLGGCASSHYVEEKASSLTFFLRMPDASQVQFSSSMDNNTLHDAVQNKSGVWQVTVPAGSGFAYFYLVDGAAYVPECRYRETDDFGSENCLYLP